MSRRWVEDDEEFGSGWLQHQRYELWFSGEGAGVG